MQTDADQVGTCITCHIFACDDHGDRPTKGRFWCFVCLQRVALNAAGYPDLITLAAVGAESFEEPLAALTDSEISRLGSRLELTMPQYGELVAPAANAALELARVLAERCAGSLDVEQLRGHPRRYDVIDPRLVDTLGLR